MCIDTYISIELPDKARKIVVLEKSGEEIGGEGAGVPHHKTVALSTPRDYIIAANIIHHIIRLHQKRRRTSIMKAFHWLRWKRSFTGTRSWVLLFNWV